METIINVTFTVVACANCSMSFAVMRSFADERRADHETFYCPQGHRNYYPGKSDVEKLREELARARENTQYYARRTDELYDEKKAVERKYAAQKGQVTRIKNRVAKGVCPCCNRTFTNLATHMERQHPDFAQTSTEREAQDSE
jgi:hypothetical protein